MLSTMNIFSCVCCSGKSFLHSDLKFIEFSIAPRSRRFHKNAYDFGIIENVSRYESETTSWSEYFPWRLKCTIVESQCCRYMTAWLCSVHVQISLFMTTEQTQLSDDSISSSFLRISSASNELPNSIIEINQFTTKVLQSGAIILSHALPP